MTTYKAVYRDGTIIGNLSYEESLDIFEEARDTDNPCALFYDEVNHMEI